MSLSCFWENFKELPDQDHNGNANKKVNKEVQEALESLKEHIERDNLTFGSAFPRVDVLKNKAQNLVNALEQKPTIEKELERLEKNINEVE